MYSEVRTLLTKLKSIFKPKEEQELQEEMIADKPIEKVNNRKSVLDCVEIVKDEKKKKKINQNKTDELMEHIISFRQETKELDYLREEIERVMETEGEERILKGFANAYKK